MINVLPVTDVQYCNDWEQASAITNLGRGQDLKIFSFFDKN
ncbi:MAG: hypothetical protein Ct9H90mP2_13410 [Dehalococcoidia bacterium]|nr:MAG: hypothetical protein Ct9H90mP2_13410 [Dehalococcoidia bacterium]